MLNTVRVWVLFGTGCLAFGSICYYAITEWHKRTARENALFVTSFGLAGVWLWLSALKHALWGSLLDRPLWLLTTVTSAPIICGLVAVAVIAMSSRKHKD